MGDPKTICVDLDGTLCTNTFGDYESAAVLRGFAETHMFLTLGMGTTDFSREFQSIPALLIEHLGAERHAELVAQGSALNGNEAAAYLRAAADKMA